MEHLWLALLYGSFAGLMIPLGGLVARVERIQPRWLELEFRHSVIAFGGGILVAAVALVLVPEGMEVLPAWAAIAAFLAGALIFARIERAQRAHGGAHAQFLAMMTDFVPEAIALGAMLSAGAPEAGLLALMIGLQNLPEGFNAWREMGADGRVGRSRTMTLFLALAAVGPVAVLFGDLVLAGLPQVTGAIMMGAAGGILFLMFQDIAVEAHLENRQTPSLAAIGGFGVGLLAQALLG
ncbi:divalent cation transporter [Limibaculum sp. M0105]|uniref:Divalent cation transporter n=1 Tax=Thermohalobaculum xanthum TaxID=2753746 RepID=A0A8J7M7E8_9RHOB|nr:divalent cation transporter [Thermohalobaculum xanthum]MBK0399075.1 divalent cation transporter [Thermohalobaculum xanthum]